MIIINFIIIIIIIISTISIINVISRAAWFGKSTARSQIIVVITFFSIYSVCSIGKVTS